MSTEHSFILKLSCPDRPGIVHAVSGFLFERGSNILDSAQFGDSRTGEFFMRVHFQQVGGDPGLDALRDSFSALAERFTMRWELHDASVKPRVVIMVSKIGHCLNDLLFRYRTGQLPIEISAIISNHQDFYQLAASYNIPFHHFPLTESTASAKAAQEARVLEVIEQHQTDLVVLARYMQILSPQLCEQLAGRAINIHHSFLPSFKGAKPYYQAFDRGVKLIGATAHYVTIDLDEGPIIEQEVERVDHSMTPDQLTAIGRDVECVTLARAVKWHVEHRIVLNGTKTVVFR
ncbi:formyltetrahydrofolate deformylase [Trinickia mobilis]|uniref:formyltetrahydrofolate deformylase n=1 Tax=Trinickia mobilis TaxID=2816356 RepID=UPI001A902CD1|nr:formyltetrahydrofolate deformylase [Trinickia mobilis]